MRRWSLSIATALGALVLAAPADALNFCFNPGTDAPAASLAVAQKFKKPAKGACSPIHGFDILWCKDCGGVEGPPLVVGTACLNSAGDTLRIAYTIQLTVTVDSEVGPAYVTMNLPYPSLQGGHAKLVGFDAPGVSYGSATAHANACIPPVIPIP